MLADLIKKLNEDEGIEPPLKANEKGVYEMPFDERISLTINELDDKIRLTCLFHSYPQKEEEEILTQMMHGNLFGQGTKGAVLGLSDDGKTLTIVKSIDYNINYKEFKDQLEDFLNMIDYWYSEITHLEEGI